VVLVDGYAAQFGSTNRREISWVRKQHTPPGNILFF
jgi:hypothetical protein